jgi:2-oxo-hept-3-ene-1,7-dioate hydratase
MSRTLSDEQIGSIVAAHEAARRSVTPIDPVTRHHPDVTLEDAYAIQAAWIDLQVANGAVVRGHKIGLTSRAMQMAMNIDEPDYGGLLDYMFIPNGGSIAAADYLDPKIEVEFAFVLKDQLVPHDLGRELTRDDVYAATDYVVPALELIDARSHRVQPDDGRTRTVCDTISDNAANAGIVVDDEQVGVDDAQCGDLRWAGAICSRNGVVEETGLGAGVLDDPVLGIVWLASRLQRIGIPLVAGETILAGSFTRPVDCRAGDHFHVDFGYLGVLELDVT